MERIDEAIEIYKGFDRSFYWLEAMVNLGDISKSEAGFIINSEKITIKKIFLR